MPKGKGFSQSHASSSNVQAKLELLIEAAIARGRVRGPETLNDLDQAALDYYRVARIETMEREHSYGVCNESSCPLCERARHEEPEEESA